MEIVQIIGSQALRSVLELAPVDGPGGRIFPPTYPAPEGSRDKAARHVVEELPDGSRRVLIDSVASQANRQELALAAARKAGLFALADVYVDLTGTEAGIGKLSATEMPHRLSDAILRDSEIDGVPFAQSEVGKRILAATPNDLTPIIETSPTTLLYGCWFSQHKLARPLKIQRSVSSEIWAHHAVLGHAVGSRIDPLGIEKLQLYEATDGGWTALEAEAAQKGGKPKPFSKKRPSEINHGNIAPSIRSQGITAESIVLRWAMPMAAIRRLRFGGGERDLAGQCYIVALGILARVLDHQAGYSLRSRCDLISQGPLSIDVIGFDGEVTSHTITVAAAMELLGEAEEGMRKADIALHGAIEALPGKRLIGLIAANRAAQELDEDGEA